MSDGGQLLLTAADRTVHTGHDRLERRGRDVGVDADAPEHASLDRALDVARRRRVAAGQPGQAPHEHRQHQQRQVLL